MSGRLRCFRLRERLIKTNQILKHRDYIGVENLVKYGRETYERYNRKFTTECNWDTGKLRVLNVPPYQKTYAELCESIDGKWVILPKEHAESLLFNSTIDK